VKHYLPEDISKEHRDKMIENPPPKHSKEWDELYRTVSELTSDSLPQVQKYKNAVITCTGEALTILMEKTSLERFFFKLAQMCSAVTKKKNNHNQ
jgi:hypothetical protein